MTKGAEGERFLIAFSALKAAVGDNPERLDAAWPGNDCIQSLCDELAQLVRGFEVVEEWSPLAFTNYVSPAAALARRDFDARWKGAVNRVANREWEAMLNEILGEHIIDADDGNIDGDAVHDPLAIEIIDWKETAAEQAAQIKQMIDNAFDQREMDDLGDYDWVDDSLRAWDRLVASGLDIAGALWRRRALPYVLVPSHVAKYYGTARASLYRRLHQAGKAFTFGAPLAALALQRAVMEEVLTIHWGAEKGWVRNADLPDLSWDSRANRLKNLANDALHGDPEKLSADALDRAVIENFLLLRLLIEHAPQTAK